ncbi:MAG: laminin G [Candidatus Marinimicrobia bacterium]|nr:laminin G [Candidatus Neomarinimicrobiota bacterium]
MDSHKTDIIQIILISIFSPVLLMAGDLVLDKNALSQYQTDNFLRFDPFDFDNIFESTYFSSKITNDTIDVSNKGIILGSTFTQELRIFTSQKGKKDQLLIGDIFSDSKDRPPTIFLANYGTGIWYGFGTGSNYKYIKADEVFATKGWYHIAVTFDGTNYKLFINGEEVLSSIRNKDLTPANTSIKTIGVHFFGDMDEVRMWDVARTESEIKDNMNVRLTGSESNLVAYYPMDVNSDYKLIDLTSNQNHGVIKNVDIIQKFSSSECDSPDGTESCPYPTINSALDGAQPGDRVLIKEGHYPEYIKRFELNNVKIEGYSGHNVTIDGTISLDAQWEPYNHNGHDIYKAVLDLGSISQRNLMPVDSIYSVFVNDRYMIMSMPVNFKNPTDPTTGNPLNPEPGTVFDKAVYSPVRNDLGYQPGTLADLDTLEEWSFDPSTATLYLYPSPNNIPTSTNVRVRTRKVMISLKDCNQMEFRNLHFFSGSINTIQCDHFVVEDSKFSFSVDMKANEGNKIYRGEYGVLRNCVFENMNNSSPWTFHANMYPLVENVLFQNTDWFRGTANYPSTAANFRGSYSGGDLIHGSSVWRYVTVKDVFGAGITPGYRSLVEYSRLENLYELIDGSGVQRNGASAEYSTTRYTWIINGPDLNGVRWNSMCGGTYADAHHVVSIGNRRGFRLKGDYHDAIHLLAYDNSNQDISLTGIKYCGPDRTGPFEPGNVNSKLLNTVSENGMDCNNVAACKDVKKQLTVADSLVSAGNWIAWGFRHGGGFNWSHATHNLADPWLKERAKSEQTLLSSFGENPWKNNIQNYDFRPKKGSALIDGGVVLPGINDGQDIDFNHPPSYPGQNRKYIGGAPDIGAYEYGDSVYWIPGYRYPYPSVPIPSSGTVDLPMEYGLAWNYPYKKDYSDVSAEVTISGPGINKIETFQYPNNVLFETFEPGGTYNWSVSVDGVNGGTWTFTVDNKIYPLNDRSVDTTANSRLPAHLYKDLVVSNNRLVFLRFDIPSSVNRSYRINLNLVPEKVHSLNSGVILYKYDYKGWNESLGQQNIGVVDKSLLTPIDTLFSLIPESGLSIDLSDFIESSGEHSFALGISSVGDSVSFYSKEKFLFDGLGGYVKQMSVWPSLSFTQDSLSVSYDVSLNEGWNLISVPFDGVRSRPKDILGTLINNDQLLYVSNPKGYYSPDDPYSTLGTLNSKDGYYVKVGKSADKIYFRGKVLSDASVSLSAGWNLISYYPDYELNIEDAFAALMSSNNLQYVIGFDEGALVYDPNATSSNTLNILKPTRGYWVKVNEAVSSFSFPSQSQSSGKLAINHPIRHSEVKPTPSFMFLKGKITGKYSVGDVVKVISEEGKTVGAIGITSGGVLRNSPVYGDDFTTEAIDGLEAGEQLTFVYDGDTLSSEIQFNSMSHRDIELEFEAPLPSSFALHQNYPNPFNPVTTIRYDVPDDGLVRIIIYDLMGRKIKTLVDGVSTPGRYSITWNGTDDFGKPVSSGMYFYRMKSIDFQSVKKLMLLK